MLQLWSYPQIINYIPCYLSENSNVPIIMWMFYLLLVEGKVSIIYPNICIAIAIIIMCAWRHSGSVAAALGSQPWFKPELGFQSCQFPHVVHVSLTAHDLLEHWSLKSQYHQCFGNLRNTSVFGKFDPCNYLNSALLHYAEGLNTDVPTINSTLNTLCCIFNIYILG